MRALPPLLTAATNPTRFAIEVVIGGLLLATLIGSAIAYYLVRDVSQGISSIIEPMRALGEGDLSAAIRHDDDDTEIGRMRKYTQGLSKRVDRQKGRGRRRGGRGRAQIPAIPANRRGHARIRIDDRRTRELADVVFDRLPI